jgi:ribonuclease BN (tRNA processing enzyme)
MEIQFLGVGEACDENFPNTSLHLRNENGLCLLLDCGFTTPHQYFSVCQHADELDGVWISHFHGDHFLGLPLLLLRFWEMGRKKKLCIFGSKGVREKTFDAMELAYPSFANRIEFDIECVVVEPGEKVLWESVSLQTAEAMHSLYALALRVESDGKSLFYSGDGMATDQTRRLSQGCNVIVHEAFWFDKEAKGHGNVVQSIDFAQKSQADTLFLVHLQRQCRRDYELKIFDLIQKADIEIILPRTGDLVRF